MRIEPLGEAAFIVRELPLPAYEIARELNANRPPGLVEAVASYETVGLYVDPDVFDPNAFELSVFQLGTSVCEGVVVEIPCRYEGPDLPEVASRLNLDEAEVVRLHASVEYTCFAIGFCPGFPYLGYVADELVLPRREQPRQRVPAGSVAIAGRQTGIYPLDRPGGWWLIGTTDFKLVDLEAGFFALKAGDRVRFQPV